MWVNVIIQPLFYAIRQSVSAHYARRYACPVSTEKARRLRYQTGRANQASAQSTPQRCDQSAGGALCCLPHNPHFTRARSRCLISSPTSSERRRPAPYITSSIARSRTARGSLISISGGRFISSTSMFFRQMTRRFRCRNTFRRVSFEFVLADRPVQKAAWRKAVTPDLLLPALYGDCVQRNCAPPSRQADLLPALQAVFAGKIDADRLKLTLVVKQGYRAKLALHAQITYGSVLHRCVNR